MRNRRIKHRQAMLLTAAAFILSVIPHKNALADAACSGDTPSYVYVRESNLHPIPSSTWSGVHTPGPLMPRGPEEPREVPPDVAGGLETFADRSIRYVTWPELTLLDGLFTPDDIACWARAGDQIALMLAAANVYADAGDNFEKITPAELARRQPIWRSYLQQAAALRCQEPKDTRLADSLYIFRFGLPEAHNILSGGGANDAPDATQTEIHPAEIHRCLADLGGNPTPSWFGKVPRNCAELVKEFAASQCTP